MRYAVVESVHVYPLHIPMRGKVSHAASLRGFSDSIVVGLHLYDGFVGYGETLPRSYVTGETAESVVRDIESHFVPHLVEFHPCSFAEALTAIDALPFSAEDGRRIPAARAAVELALLDASMRFFDRSIDDVVGWLGLPGFGGGGSRSSIRYSGVLASETLKGTMRKLSLMSWGGLRHFKLKVGFPGDIDRLERVAHYLQRGLAAGRCTLRVDANGAWVSEDADVWVDAVRSLPLSGIEQPFDPHHDHELASFSTRSGLMTILDESLIGMEDAERLASLPGEVGFNIRISKCGGLIPSLKLAAFARRRKICTILGCMVGETSILSAAGLRFLESCPGVRWTEGCFGSFLLQDDVVRRPLRFGFGGRPPSLRDPGMGVTVRVDKVERYAESPTHINL